MSPMPTPGSMTPALQPGDKLGYFDVLEPLGAGGMSLIWKGRDSLLNRDVAIKQLADGAQIDEAARERFRAEAETQKRLSENSEYLVQVIDLIDEPRGLFIVMLYVDGTSLEHALQSSESAMDPRQGLNLIYCLALALKQIHDGGVLHRDLKPSNILLQRDGQVRVSDFGLATVIEDQDPLTMGTTRYMAPELFGEEPADARADIYALGMVAYEILAGRGEFNKAFRTVLRDERHQAMRWMKWHTNMRLTAPPLHTVNPKVPEPLSDLVARMLAKDPSQRIATADQLIQVIKRNFTAGGQAMSKPETTASAETSAQAVADENPTAPLPQRSRLPLLLALNAVILLLIVGGGVYYARVHRPKQAEQALRNTAMAQLDRGRDFYDTKQYAQAIPIFRELARDWKGDPQLGHPALIGGYLAKGFMLMEQGKAAMQQEQTDFAAVVNAYEQAIACFEAADDVPGKKPRTLIDEKIEQATNNRSSAQALRTIRQYIQAGEFDKARLEIGKLQLTELQLTELENKKLAGLVQLLEQGISQASVNSILARAKALVEQGEPAEAVKLLDKAQRQYPTNDEVGELLSGINQEIRYDAALSQARQAENAGQFGTAVTQYEIAQAIRHDADIEAKIQKLRARQALARAIEYLSQGNRDAASQELLKAKALDPSLREVDDMIDKISITNTRERMVKQANSEYAAGSYPECIAICDQILKMGPDVAIQQLKNKATLRLSCREARSAMDSGELAAAKSKIDKGLALDPADPEANNLLEEYKARVQYNQYVAAGDAYREKKNYGLAINNYRNARTVAKQSSAIPIEPIQQRLKNTEYESWIDKAHTSIKAGQWRQAWSQLNTAQGIRDTEEVRKLKAQVQNELDK